jgi:hypothetical protein
MKISKPAVVGFSIMASILFFVWFVSPYILSVSRHPIDYYYFKRDVRMGYVEVVKRDSCSWGENVILENKRDGSRYSLFHEYGKHEEFSKPRVECYEYLVDVNGEYICYKDDDKDVLKLLNTKTVK